MIRNFLVTGDCHGDFTRFKNYNKEIQKDPNTAVIILGDVGLNWTLDEHDVQLKNFLSKRYNFRIYCVRGNHEARPANVPGMKLVYDDDVHGMIWMQEEWPNIRYFKDVGIYYMGPYSVGIIGGAYSVDKWYRLDNNTIWYEDEQLTQEERDHALNDIFDGIMLNFMLTHTCPISWEPTDLFLGYVNQSRVDKTMEKFLEKVKEKNFANVWLCGHFHDDCLLRPGVEMYYKNTDSLDAIWHRWAKYFRTGELDWWIKKNPMFWAQ